ncbi:MAG: DegT/DnrJ/EryC1/StrS family aminotransferase [bacterium]|nr:DegT/DnrJ/EryC1/StrS family aminotransferase [bacterium]
MFLDLYQENRYFEKAYFRKLKELIKNSHFILSQEVEKFEVEFASYIGTKYAVGVSNGTDALELILRAINIKEDDEVITTPFSFYSSTSSILYLGAKPVFADIDPETFNIDPANIKKKITKRTKSILIVHIFGNPCNMEEIMWISNKYAIPVIEDACQAHGATYKGKKCGSFGIAGAFSFYPTKNLSCFGDGGIITTNSKEIYQKILLLRNMGRKKQYEFSTLGYNKRLDEIQAAILRIKLKKLDELNIRRINNANIYISELKNVEIQKTYDGAVCVYNTFTIRVKNRLKLIDEFKKYNIPYMIYYPKTLNNIKPFRKYYVKTPIAQKLTKEVISLPFGPFIKKTFIKKVASIVNKCQKSLL